MKLEYKFTDNNHGSFYILLQILSGALLFCVCCIPSFNSIGHFAFQIFSAGALSIICTFLFLLSFKNSLKIISNSLNTFLFIMLILAGVQQIKAQISLEKPLSEGWIYTFYYDKPLTVALVWGFSFLLILILRLVLPHTDKWKRFREDFTFFFRNSSKGFLVFYIFVLIYCFILQRTPQSQTGLNLIPFNMIMTYIDGSTSLYESIFYFTGNFICFFPFGFLYKSFKKTNDTVKIILIPIVISLLIELSQLILKNGNFDVDDILLNTAGFYLGVGIHYLFNKARFFISKGNEETIF